MGKVSRTRALLLPLSIPVPLLLVLHLLSCGSDRGGRSDTFFAPLSLPAISFPSFRVPMGARGRCDIGVTRRLDHASDLMRTLGDEDDADAEGERTRCNEAGEDAGDVGGEGEERKKLNDDQMKEKDGVNKNGYQDEDLSVPIEGAKTVEVNKWQTSGAMNKGRRHSGEG
ncbi:hypothetical protein B0H16DRAFT_1468235 [Mycena metata]|uniref:Uncharacterized protein n=1 Tax=Mycena metata TaxID=1033252 RepID=A0AAD7I1Z0_9AGAR|nr:hypothetical protein B0H16DRAFT_1468235 [Mycena metata]